MTFILLTLVIGEGTSLSQLVAQPWGAILAGISVVLTLLATGPR